MKPRQSSSSDSSQIVAVATDEQHAIIKAAVEQLQSEEAVVEVFQLQTADPIAVELAPGGAGPRGIRSVLRPSVASPQRQADASRDRPVAAGRRGDATEP